ncbi:hypothetical protein [Kitasatospora sp. NPDC005748]|uniref:hypothetical protein n=1 Tax=Kitasatospora sp. NPDC005748 TaxID=3157063 RepID=UPI0033DD2073
MSTHAQATPPPARLALLGLYPAAYRSSHGEEIAAVFAESVQDGDRRTVLREWTALAAHAVRLRTRLSSRDPAGRVLAGAAPFTLAGGAALATVHLVMSLFLTVPRVDLFSPNATATAVAGAVQTAPWILALVLAALGRWGHARLLVLAGVLAGAGAPAAFLVYPSGAFLQYVFLLPLWLLLAGPVLIAPPDAVDRSARGRTGAALAAVAVALPMTALVLRWPWAGPGDFSEPVFSDSLQTLLDVSTAWPALVMTIAYLVQLAAARPDRLRAAGAALAVLPWTAMLAPPYYWAPPIGFAELARDAGVVAAFLAVATALAALRRTRATTPEPVEPA